MTKIFSVGEVTRGIKNTLEAAYPFVWVRGQVSNLSRPASGHVYFSLKDEDASLACVWFRHAQRGEETFDPLTGEVFDDGPRPGLAAVMRNGQEMLCAGRVTVYGPRGTYQLVVELAQDVGLGELHLRFEELKKKLAGMGWFDAARKRPLPRHPLRVAVVTAATGAAVRDFVRIAADRGSGCSIRIYPVPVQGDDAPPRIAAALELAAAHDWAQVVVLIRGGGSLEDLWAFNDERVAKAVFESPLPVLTGIGHEVDTAIADMVADVRAATPSHAAQLLWPERQELVQRLDDACQLLDRAWELGMQEREKSVKECERALHWLSPQRSLERLDERFAEAVRRLMAAAQALTERKERRLAAETASLRHAFGPAALDTGLLAVRQLAARLVRAGESFAERAAVRLERETLRLKAADPLLPLERGYSILQRPDGGFVRSVAGLEAGDNLRVLVRDGAADVAVTAVHAVSAAEAAGMPAGGKKIKGDRSDDES
ncbi:exodeoxyribonuclease VII large subunit [Oleidesulfovibrio alaskensis]|jgi:exodeoxyribonuclease VII large subunit|uniref:exodeoxyribonuclease VII large subunit n=1 Tax=Oleidesulfovibrio alaskensis TaxID=58180 RepID=UPI001A4AA157|nr:exodeoxyribonuclease VII large subunit [Oleidesulfovibrio alaskensis]MBL3583353.1 exodeoxyribonuclease VII large subunit [Oleidesulfovibrio alaskensis]